MKIYESPVTTDHLSEVAELQHLILEQRVGHGVGYSHQLTQKHSPSLGEQFSIFLCQQRHLNITLASPSLGWNWVCNKSHSNLTEKSIQRTVCITIFPLGAPEV